MKNKGGPRHSVFTRLMLPIQAVVLVIMAASILLTYRVTSDQSIEDTREESFTVLNSLEWSITPLFNAGRTNSIREILEKIGVFPFVKSLKLYDPSYKILASSRPEVIGTIDPDQPAIGEIIRYSKLRAVYSNLAKGVFIAAIPIFGKTFSEARKSDIGAVLCLSVDMKYENRLFFTFFYSIIYQNLILFLIIAVLFTVFLFTIVSLPMRKLTRAAGEIAAGNYGFRSGLQSRDEFGGLAGILNGMAEKISAQNSALEEYSRGLEERVERRTADLKAANEKIVMLNEELNKKLLELTLDENRLESLRLLSELPDYDRFTILALALEESILLTGSEIGYIYLYNEETGARDCFIWSDSPAGRLYTDEENAPSSKDYPGVIYEAVRARKTVIANETVEGPAHYPGPGREIRRHLSFPLMINGKITAVIGVFNKKNGYDEGDVRQLRLLMDSIWKIIMREEYEAQLKRSLDMNVTLLKEVHHRVKNNLQIILSLINIQARKTDGSNYRDALEDIGARVRSIALIHESLYSSGDLSTINFKNYLRSLGALMERTNSSPARKIRLRFDLDEISLDIVRAVPLGLIVSELVTNSYKHAFKDRDNGEILIRFKKIDAGIAELTVRDDGAGLPEGFTMARGDSTGTKLVDMLCRQLKAGLEVKTDSGAVFTITLNMEN